MFLPSRPRERTVLPLYLFLLRGPHMSDPLQPHGPRVLFLPPSSGVCHRARLKELLDAELRQEETDSAEAFLPMEQQLTLIVGTRDVLHHCAEGGRVRADVRGGRAPRPLLIPCVPACRPEAATRGRRRDAQRRRMARGEVVDRRCRRRLGAASEREKWSVSVKESRTMRGDWR